MLLRPNIFLNPTFFFHKCMLYCLQSQKAEDAFTDLQVWQDRDRDQGRDQKFDANWTGTKTGTRNMTGPGPGPVLVRDRYGYRDWE